MTEEEARSKTNPVCPKWGGRTVARQRSYFDRGVRQVYFVYKCVKCGNELPERS